ncbi:MAG: MarR family transcriptional regulator [Atopobiaceae bacterium]|jgi:DNA-binding MarR family transcriptional regulator|nr:MarR family transcriptional regulator [Atopobiaceae bacterium]MCI2173981.1 MarR family transcriptional regulator [Atopobiaceae bacterium]MCI2207929.1 MarR family transcriptional regulator [Atopobiaceae bacterium]
MTESKTAEGASDKDLASRLFLSLGIMSRGPMRQIQGATQGEMALLGFLLATDEPTSPTEIAQRLALTTARIANTLNCLERKGLIKRTPDAVDRRRVQVTLTDEGRSFMVAGRKRALEDIQDLLDDLGEPDASEYVRIMGRIEALIAKREGIEPPPHALSGVGSFDAVAE